MDWINEPSQQSPDADACWVNVCKTLHLCLIHRCNSYF